MTAVWPFAAVCHISKCSTLIKSVSLQAGRCEPRLMEGDLVVLINGRDISEHTHDQVVMFIRASRESHSRELALLIRRRGAALSLRQPDVLLANHSHCVPGSGRVAPLLQLPSALTLPDQSVTERPRSSGSLEKVVTLEESMRQLERGVQSGTLSFHFEVFKIHAGEKQRRGIYEFIYKLEKNTSLFSAGLRLARSVSSAV